jgi:hypothetical protein
MERNSQAAVSISEDLMICIWSLSSCSLKKSVMLPSPLFSLSKTQDEYLIFNKHRLTIASLPAFIQFTEIPTIFFVITNGGDLHEFNIADVQGL